MKILCFATRFTHSLSDLRPDHLSSPAPNFSVIFSLSYSEPKPTQTGDCFLVYCLLAVNIQIMFVKESDKIIISELLFYIQNRIKCISKDILVVLCAKTFSADEIKQEKTKLFDSINVRTTERKKGPEQLSRNLHDIVDKMIELDNTGADIMPTFVARDLSKLPKMDDSSGDHSASFEVLINSVHDLAASVRTVESQMVTQKSMNEMFDVLPSICLRGNSVSSSPRRRLPPEKSAASSTLNPWAAPHLQTTSLTAPPVTVASLPTPLWLTPAPDVSAPSIPASSILVPPVSAPSVSPAPSFSSSSVSTSSVSTISLLAPSVSAPSVLAPSVSTPSVSTPSISTTSISASSSSTPFSVASSLNPPLSAATSVLTSVALSGATPPVTASPEGFVRITRRARKSHSDGPRQKQPTQRSQSRPRRQNNLVVGRKVVDGLVSCRGADLTRSVYLGHFDINSTYEAVKTSIESQNVTVIELEELKLNHSRFKSFRLCLKKDSMPKILDPDFWPSGVVVRRFWRGKTPQSPPAPPQ